MKFGLFTHLPWPEGLEPKQVLEQTTEEIVTGEELGFCGAWMAEHHFTRYGLGASSLLFAANVAAQTKTIRLGTAVLVPSLHHPVRLAEEAATLDVLSNGRFDAGFGRGASGYEYRGYGVDRDESQGRFQEAINVIQGLWTTPGFSHHGQYFDLEETNLVPMPLQKPHPPIYLAATRTPATLEYVVSTGHPLMLGVVLDTVEALDLCQRFVVASRDAGHNVPMSAIPFARYFYVGETEAQARKDTEEALNWTMDMNQFRRTFDVGSEVYHKLDDWRRTRTEAPPDYEQLFQRRAMIGSPEQCIAKIKEVQDQGIDYLLCNFSFGGMKQSNVLRSMRLFAQEVMPHFT